MKRVITASALASAILAASSSLVLAQVSASPSPGVTVRTTPAARGDIRLTGAVERDQRLEERKDRMEDRAASRAAKLDARKQAMVDRIIAHAKRMLERAQRRIERLDAIWKRVVTRMDKIKASGKDLTSLDPLVTDVSTKRQKALDAVNAAQNTVDGLIGSNEPKPAVETFRSQFKSVIDALKGYHQSIIAVIRSLKGLGKGEGLTQTPTASGGAIVGPTITVAPTTVPTITP